MCYGHISVGINFFLKKPSMFSMNILLLTLSSLCEHIKLIKKVFLAVLHFLLFERNF